ncbi:MAG: YkgJ family cysteine cluster protein [Candidatus Lokiarchaeota archaeon]|nr:YkgJ family cysteine cluster protein [Candidatus Harpocratesius repetitus]
MKLCASASHGIYFNCTQCGKCCSSDSEGYIFVFWNDIKRISTFLKLSYEEFAQKYLNIVEFEFTLWDTNLENTHIQKSMDTLVLNFSLDQNCIFLISIDEIWGCQIYQARPKQCELYPFWSMIMISERNFINHQRICPGFRIKGEEKDYYNPNQIEKLVKIERKIERDYYLKMKEVNFDIFQMYPFLKNVRKFRINK